MYKGVHTFLQKTYTSDINLFLSSIPHLFSLETELVCDHACFLNISIHCP